MARPGLRAYRALYSRCPEGVSGAIAKPMVHRTSCGVESFYQKTEQRYALKVAFAFLFFLTVAKSLQFIPYLGVGLVTLVAAAQLWIPIQRAEKHGLDWDVLGLHRRNLWGELKTVLWLVLIFFPFYALIYHWFLTSARMFFAHYLPASWAMLIPAMQFELNIPQSFGEGWSVGLQGLELMAIHWLGVALPEETFYRGYLQPQFEAWLPPKTLLWGALFGRATVMVCFLFALGHVLGEWNPLRLGPFFPALVFAWQRNLRQSIIGAIVFHGLCNLFGILVFSQYAPL